MISYIPDYSLGARRLREGAVEAEKIVDLTSGHVGFVQAQRTQALCRCMSVCFATGRCSRTHMYSSMLALMKMLSLSLTESDLDHALEIHCRLELVVLEHGLLKQT